jgi:hypothetical protein
MRNLHQGGIRHLDFTNDGLSLYYSTHQDSSIQQYSVNRMRLLEPVQTNDRPPIAMAISPTGHLMITATDNPSVVLMRNLQHNSAAVVVKTSASEAAVSSIAFHPKRPDIFVLAFVDGTLAAYDATKISKAAAGSAYVDSQSKGEIGRVVGLYKAIATSTSMQGEQWPTAPIVGVAFLPDYILHVVAAGADGRCRLVDFAQGGSILRTWHTKMPITSLDIIEAGSNVASALDPAGSSAQERKSSRTGSVKPTSTTGNSLIVVSRINGTVQICNTLGLLLSEKSITSYDEKIISIAWMKGASPASLDNSAIENRFSEGSEDLNGISVPPMAVQQATDDSGQYVKGADEGTTRIRSSPGTSKPTLAPLTRADFQDLFSPIKPQSPPRVLGDRITKGSSPKRYRPGLSNQTFVQSPLPDSDTQADVAPPRNLALFPSSESDVYMSAPSRQPQSDVSDQKKAKVPLQNTGSFGLPLIAKKRNVAFKASTPRRQISGFTNSTIPPNTNARVLADLRKLAGTNSSASRQTGTLSSFAPAQQRLKPSASSQRVECDDSGVHDPKAADAPSSRKRRSVHLHDSSTWPTDSVSDPSFDDGKVEDIWLTSEAEEAQPQLPRRRGHHRKRISKSSTLFPEDFDSGIGYSEPGTVPQPASTHLDDTNLRFTHMISSDHGASQDPINGFRPVTSTTPLLGGNEEIKDNEATSDAVRRLFPRSSSRSPRRRRQDTTTLTRLSPQPLSDDTTAQSARDPRPRRKEGAAATLMSLALQSTEKEQRKTRKSVKRSGASQQRSNARRPPTDNHSEPNNPHGDDDIAHQSINIDNDPASQQPPAHPGPLDYNATTTDARVAVLENEVFALKAEVLALKALLRRHGIPASQVQAASVMAVDKAKKSSGWRCLRD